MLKKLILFLLPFVFVSNSYAAQIIYRPSSIDQNLNNWLNPTNIFTCDGQATIANGGELLLHFTDTGNRPDNPNFIRSCFERAEPGDFVGFMGFANENLTHACETWYSGDIFDYYQNITVQGSFSTTITSNGARGIDCVYIIYDYEPEPVDTPQVVSDFGDGIVSGVTGIAKDVLPIAFAGLGSFMLFHFAWVVLGNLIAKKNGFPNAKSFNKATDDYFEKKGIL